MPSATNSYPSLSSTLHLHDRYNNGVLGKRCSQNQQVPLVQHTGEVAVQPFSSQLQDPVREGGGGEKIVEDTTEVVDVAKEVDGGSLVVEVGTGSEICFDCHRQVFVRQQDGTASRSVKFTLAAISAQVAQLEVVQQDGELEVQRLPVQLQATP